MNLHVGGFGLQGITGFPVVRVFFEKGKWLELICNGLSGFYAVIFEKFGKEEADRRAISFLKTFEEPLRIMERAEIPDRKKGIEYCTRWSLKPAVRSWSETWPLVNDLADKTVVFSEVLDLAEKRVTKISGNSRDVALSFLAMPGLFPPFEGKYVTTTYLSQIPVSFVQDGDTVYLNLRDLSGKRPVNAAWVISQSMELKSIHLAKTLLAKKKVDIIPTPLQLKWDDANDIYSVIAEEITGCPHPPGQVYGRLL